MHLLIFSPQDGATFKGLRKTAQQVLSDRDIQICHDFEGFRQILSKPPAARAAALVLAESAEDLEALAGLAPLIFKPVLILVLPMLNDRFLTLGHKLRPRYLTDQRENFREILQVLDHLNQNWERILPQGACPLPQARDQSPGLEEQGPGSTEEGVSQ